ncbi:MAG: hypothetical protein R2834_16180 [Rhodothermales bacterium]
MRRLSISLTLFVLLSAFSPQPAGKVQLAFFRVSEDPGGMVVSWQVDTEDEVKEYELLRMTRFTNNRFVKVESFPPHGVNKAYSFKDSQIFKASTEQVDYQLEVVYANGQREQLAREQVNYTSTAIRRTWGSIKAMFQ